MEEVKGKILVVMGARDSVGKSTFTVNIGTSFQRETGKKVLLIDADIENCGELLQFLGMKEAKSLTSISGLIDRLDASILRGYISTDKSGVGLFLLYSRKEDIHLIDIEGFRKVLDIFSRMYDYILIDGGAKLNQIVLKAIELSSLIFVLTTPELITLNRTEHFLERLRRLHFPKEMVKIVLNMFEPRGVITLEMVTQKLQRQILTQIIKDEALTKTSLIQGSPFVISQPRSILTRNYDEIVRNIIQRRIIETAETAKRPDKVILDDEVQLDLDIKNDDIGKGRSWSTYATSRFFKKETKTLDIKTQIKRSIHKRLVDFIDLKKLNIELQDHSERDRVLREKAENAIISILDQEGKMIKTREERQQIVKEVLDEALGLGPLEDFLSDDSITEIMVNTHSTIYIEKEGRLYLTDASFSDDEQLMAVIERIVSPLGRRIDEKSPMVDARLKDGSRVNAIIPPLAIDGPCLTIRKFARDPYTYKDIIRFGTMTEEMSDFFRACIEARLNIVISGGTGSGKTTLLNVVSSFIPNSERIVTIEDSAELQLHQPHVIRLESRPPNIEGEGEITIRDLVRNSLRMRPDRIIVGECRGAEALDMLQAMNTGHDGSLTTIHCNSPRDALSRLETLIMFAGTELPSRAIREQIQSAIDIIIHLQRFPDGARKIVQVAEITGIEGQVITMQDIFLFKQEGVSPEGKILGRFIYTGLVPRFIETLKAKGVRIPKGIFIKGGDGMAVKY